MRLLHHLFVACFVLFGTSCAASKGITDTVDASGDLVRIEDPEEAAPADAATVKQRMGAYRQQAAAAQLQGAGAPNAEQPSRGVEVTEEAAGREPEEEEESGVSATTVKERMVSYRALPPAARLVTMGADLSPMTEGQANGYDPFLDRDCPPEGSAQTTKTKKQNKLKNRVTTPHASTIDQDVTFAALRAPGEDHDRWSTAFAATIEGYCAKVMATGAETCNCGATDKSLTDAHFEILASKTDQELPIIAEVTPVWRLIHQHFGQEDWSSTALRQKYQGHKVRITGWLFFDEAHLHEATNTDPNDNAGNKNWRSTCWEIHPITSIQVIN